MPENKTEQEDKAPDSNLFVRLLRNVGVGIRAPGPAAIMMLWLLCVTALGLFGDGEYVSNALTLLIFFAGLVLVSLASKL